MNACASLFDLGIEVPSELHDLGQGKVSAIGVKIAAHILSGLVEGERLCRGVVTTPTSHHPTHHPRLPHTALTPHHAPTTLLPPAAGRASDKRQRQHQSQ